MIKYVREPNSLTFGIYTGNNDSLSLKHLLTNCLAKYATKPDGFLKLVARLDAYAVCQSGGALDLRSPMRNYTRFENRFQDWNSSIEDAVHQLPRLDGRITMPDGNRYDTQFYRVYYFVLKHAGEVKIIVVDSKIPLFVYRNMHICRHYENDNARKWHEQTLSTLVDKMERKFGYNNKTGHKFDLMGVTKGPEVFNLYLSSEIPYTAEQISGADFVSHLAQLVDAETGEAEFDTFSDIVFLEDMLNWINIA